jgi:dienelactone hydrolase
MVRGGHSVRRVRYLLTASEWGYAWMLVPAQARLGKKCAAVIAHHQTSAHGKYEAAGMEVTPGEEWLAYGQELAERGYVVMAPDAIAFGERQGGHAHAKYHSADEFFAAHPQGGVMGKMAYDTSRAIDVLETLPEVDPTRIGCVGHSHGGYGTLFSMVQDDRIKAGVVSCGVTLLRADPTPQRWWRMTALMPRLGLYEGDMPSTPIDFHHWIALVAPRPLAVVVGTKDAIFPNAAPVADAIEEARKVYALYGAADKLQGQVFEGPHSLPEAQKVRAFQLLKDTLRP